MSKINFGDHVRLVKDENLAWSAAAGRRHRYRVDGNTVRDGWDDRSGSGMFEASRFEKVTLQ